LIFSRFLLAAGAPTAAIVLPGKLKKQQFGEMKTARRTHDDVTASKDGKWGLAGNRLPDLFFSSLSLSSAFPLFSLFF
jgi:hypothetical protein